MLWFRFCLWINFYFAFSHGNLWQTKSKQGEIYIKHFRPRKTLNHYAFTRYFSDEILWSHEVNFDHLYSVVLITLFLALLQALVIFPCRLCSKHIASMFFTISYKRRNVWEKKIAQSFCLRKKNPADRWA